MNTNSENIHHTLHLHVIPVDTIYAFPLTSTQQNNLNPHFHSPLPPRPPTHTTGSGYLQRTDGLTMFRGVVRRFGIAQSYVDIRTNIT